MENNVELNLEEMEQVSGGTGGYPHRPEEKKGLDIYQIVRGDTLTKIANRFGTTVSRLKQLNPTIHDINDITAGYFIYVPYKAYQKDK